MPDTEDLHYGMKKLALHNWREPDVPKSFPGLTEDKWVPAVMEGKLTSMVDYCAAIGAADDGFIVTPPWP